MERKHNSIKPVSRPKSLQNKTNLRPISVRRHESITAFEELIQCGICLEKLSDARMLPCQHTFCLSCLQSHFIAKKFIAKAQTQTPTVQQIQTVMSNQGVTLKCPMCMTKVELENGFDSLEALPRNLYIDSLLKVIDGNISPLTIKTQDYRCSKCQTFSQEEEKVCQHCRQIFCKICWTAHLSELEQNFTILRKQVAESKMRLDHKLEILENRYEQLCDNIRKATLEKISFYKEKEKEALSEIKGIEREGKILRDNIIKQITEFEDKLSTMQLANETNKVTTFMNLHSATSALLTQVNHYGEARVIFDPDTFQIDQDTEGIYNGGDECETTGGSRITNPFQDEESMIEYYKSRSFTAKLIWNRCPRPTNIGISPWDDNLVYICATDTHTVLIFNRERKKLEGRLTFPDMLCPQGVAFSKKYNEIYVSDKWKHCIHVFSPPGEYLRTFLSKGSGTGKVRSPDAIAIGPNDELIISDSGNDRVIVVNPQTGDNITTIGTVNNKTMLNMPTGLAVSGRMIVVADTGNHRIKIFDLKSGDKLHEFGMLGREKGQFRSVEVVAVDPMGFILVGDGGNARIQVFKPDGTLVKIFGGQDLFGWVSGILITNDLDIITTDSKLKCLKIF